MPQRTDRDNPLLMSNRNTGLFVAGHLTDDACKAFQLPNLRIGHAVRKRKRYSHIGLTELEENGSAFFDQLELPSPSDPVRQLLEGLSKTHGKAVLLFCDDEQGAGGHVLFENGEMHSRDVVDGRAYTPVRRTEQEELVLENLDSSEWVWPLISAALEQGARGIVGLGIRDDDDIEALIEAAGSMAEEHYTPPSRQSAPEAQIRGRGDRVGRLFQRIKKKIQR